MSSRSWPTSVWNCCLDIASLIMARSGSEVKKGRAGIAGGTGSKSAIFCSKDTRSLLFQSVTRAQIACFASSRPTSSCIENTFLGRLRVNFYTDAAGPQEAEIERQIVDYEQRLRQQFV